MNAKARVVAVVMEKGWEQVVAVLAIHRAQCAYLPVDARLWPEHRIRQVLELSESCAIVTQSHLMTGAHAWMQELDIPIIQIDAKLNSSPAPANMHVYLDRLARAFLTEKVGHRFQAAGMTKRQILQRRGTVKLVIGERL